MTSLPPSSAWWKEADVMLSNAKTNDTGKGEESIGENVKIMGIFFGSYKNRSTKHFVKYLSKVYAHTTEEKIPWEVIYIPQDEDEADCQYFVRALMGSWLFVPWSNQQLRRKVRNMYNVSEQPSLVVIKNDEKGSVVTVDGKGDLLDYGYFCCKEWITAAEAIVIPPPPASMDEMDDHSHDAHPEGNPENDDTIPPHATETKKSMRSTGSKEKPTQPNETETKKSILPKEKPSNETETKKSILPTGTKEKPIPSSEIETKKSILQNEGNEAEAKKSILTKEKPPNETEIKNSILPNESKDEKPAADENETQQEVTKPISPSEMETEVKDKDPKKKSTTEK